MDLPFSSTLPGKFPESGLPERIGMPDALNDAQEAAAKELIDGPRRGVIGPFRPLLHRPALLRAFARVGESLRFEGTLDNALREWTICVVARETANIFEWDTHLPLAASAGVPVDALHALASGAALPADAPAPLGLARSVARELLSRHRLDDATYARAQQRWGESTLVELIALIGYFAAVCSLMNAARTPGPSVQA